MGWRCEWRTVCDQCGAYGPRGPEQGSDAAERRAVRIGWIAWDGFYGSFHACPDCKGRLSEELGLAQSLADSNAVRGGLDDA